MESLPKAEQMFSQFWDRYQHRDAFRPAEPSRCIPMFVHGDEGRGQAKRPIMVLSVQPIYGWGGEEETNMKKRLALLSAHAPALRSTYTTRLLYTLLPSERYAPKGVSLQQLLQGLVLDFQKLESEGFEAPEIIEALSRLS